MIELELPLEEVSNFLDEDPNDPKFLFPLYLPIELPNESIDPFENTFADVYFVFDEASFKLFMSERMS